MLPDRQLTRHDLPFPLNRPLTGQDLIYFVHDVLQPLWSQAANAILPFVGVVASVQHTIAPKTVTVNDVLFGVTVTAQYDSKNVTATVGSTVYGFTSGKQSIAIGTLA